MNEPPLPGQSDVPLSIFGPNPMQKPPSVQQQSVGTIVSIVIIVLMIIIGAFYAWGQRISQNQQLIETASSTAAY